MRRSPKSLDVQLDAYGAAVKPLPTNGVGRLGNWPVYAMATGSALAMATSANAGIIYSGPLALTASVPPVEGLTQAGPHEARIFLSTGPFAGAANSILVGVADVRSRGFLSAFAYLGEFNIFPLDHLKRLAFGAVISGLAGNFSGGKFSDGILAEKSNLGFDRGSWPDGVVGYAGARLRNGDYAWLKLSWSGEDNFPDTINVYGWAVTDGTSIHAGDTGVSSSPEPGTLGLALLAAGAAGVLAWRKRKQTAVE